MRTLDQLGLILGEVVNFIEKQRSIDGLPDSISLVQSILGSCVSDMDRLNGLVSKVQAYFNRQGRVQKIGASLETALEKEEVGQLRRRIHQNMTALQNAIAINKSQLQ